MIVSRLVLENYGPFECAELAFGPGVHVVRGGNGEGKSMLLAAIPYALFGTPNAAELVRHGQREMRVSLELSTGLKITRGVRDGAGFVTAEGVEDARRRDVDAFVSESIGLFPDELENTAILVAGKLGRLAEAGAAERRDIFAEWVVPKLWATIEVRALTKLKLAETALGILRGKLAALVPDAVEEDRLEATRKLLELKEKELQDLPVADPGKISKISKILSGQREYIKNLVVVDSLLENPPIVPTDEDSKALEADLAQLDAQRTILKRKADEAARLAQGKFDGPCPVDGVECPRAAEIRGAIAKHAANRDRFRGELMKVQERAEEDRRKLYTLREAREAWVSWRSRAQAALDRLGAPPRGSPLPPEAPDPSRESSLRSEIGALREKLRRADEDREKAKALQEEISALEVSVAAWAWLSRAASRDGVPAILVDRAADTIANHATTLLANAGSPLRVQFRKREALKRLADVCPACRIPYPKKAKACACGRIRTNATVNDLTPLVHREDRENDQTELRRRSSAEKDLVALGLRLGACSWRRERSGSPWSVLVLDEIDAHVSPANAEMLNDLVHRGLSEFEQIFVSSHRSGASSAGARILRVFHDGNIATVQED